jgi:nucleotide-binding universal stress UspA family protein
MEILLVLTDSSTDCGKALEVLKDMGEKFSATVKILAVLEDLYRLEKTSVSLGLPIPRDTVPEAKRRVKERLKGIWRQLGGPEVEMEVVAGDLREEVLRRVPQDERGLLIWGCALTPSVCRIIDEIGIPSLIIK